MRRWKPPKGLEFPESPPMTGSDLFQTAAGSEMVRRCIPENLAAGLPRLAHIRNRRAIQVWYFYPNELDRSACLLPKFYLAQNVGGSEVLELKAFTRETRFSPSSMERFYQRICGGETEYLEACAGLLNGSEIDGGQLSAIPERWAAAQRGAVLHWVETFPDIPRFVRRIILQSYLTPDPEELLARYC